MKRFNLCAIGLLALTAACAPTAKQAISELPDGSKIVFVTAEQQSPLGADSNTTAVFLCGAGQCSSMGVGTYNQRGFVGHILPAMVMGGAAVGSAAVLAPSRVTNNNSASGGTSLAISQADARARAQGGQGGDAFNYNAPSNSTTVIPIQSQGIGINVGGPGPKG